MSRSQPNENSPHPCERWFEWDGTKGNIRYYDKENKKQVEVPLPFNFVLLDQLSTVKGWNDKVDSGIYANEVKDTRSEELIVKYFKGGEVARGFYADIKDTIVDAGGHFVLNCYVAFNNGGDLGNSNISLGSLQFKASALNAWMEFVKKNRSTVWKEGVVISGYNEDKKGAITFRVPVFAIAPLTDDDNDAAATLDRALQSYIKQYSKKGEPPPEHVLDEAEPELQEAVREYPF